MNKTLIQAGIIAIPLKNKLESDLGLLHPNFIVFDSQFGKTKSLSPNIQTGVFEELDCVQTVYKIVYREILTESNGKPEEFIERTLIPLEELSIPITMLPVIFTYQSIKDNLSIVNLALSRFQFRGVLSNLVLEVDEDKLDEILAE